MTAKDIISPQIEVLLLDRGLNLVCAVVILFAGWIAARWMAKWTQTGLDKIRHFDETLKPLLTTLVRYGILTLTFIAVLQRFGVETTSFLAILGAAGLAVGLALQGALSNVAAGVMLLLLRPFRVNDNIEVNKQGGTVREINLFTTILITADLIYISVPNASIFGATITNYSREPLRRINFNVRIDYSDDIDKTQNAILEILQSDPHVLKTPAPEAPVDALGESSVHITVRCWVRNRDYADALSAIQKTVKRRFDDMGLSVPYPQRVVSIRGTAAKKELTAAAGAD